MAKKFYHVTVTVTVEECSQCFVKTVVTVGVGAFVSVSTAIVSFASWSSSTRSPFTHHCAMPSAFTTAGRFKFRWRCPC